MKTIDLSKLKLGDKLTIDVRVSFIDIGSDLPLGVDIGDVDDLWLSPTCIKSCNARLTDSNSLEIEGIRIATLTAERDKLVEVVRRGVFLSEQGILPNELPYVDEWTDQMSEALKEIEEPKREGEQ